ncbi:MAG TPA: methyltransferase domain-containing protein [Xanthobacteraceae bacterium]|jgi:SAM-dependent methyltransferase
MGDWIAFWDSNHPIYVNPRHRDVHYRAVAQGILSRVRPNARILDYGCGEALHADLIAASAAELSLCETAKSVRTALARRFDGHARIFVRSPEELAALPDGSFDVVVLHSVAQYLTAMDLDTALALFRRLLTRDGLLILGDILPPHVTAATDAIALLRFGLAHGFLGAALIGLVRTVASDYWRLRSRLGLTRYKEAAMIEKLADAGFCARRDPTNIGHNPARMTFLARPA